MDHIHDGIAISFGCRLVCKQRLVEHRYGDVGGPPAVERKRSRRCQIGWPGIGRLEPIPVRDPATSKFRCHQRWNARCVSPFAHLFTGLTCACRGKAVSMGTLTAVKSTSSSPFVTALSSLAATDGPQFPSLDMLQPFAHDGATAHGFQPHFFTSGSRMAGAGVMHSGALLLSFLCSVAMQALL